MFNLIRSNITTTAKFFKIMLATDSVNPELDAGQADPRVGSGLVGSGPDLSKFRRVGWGSEIWIFLFTFFANCRKLSIAKWFYFLLYIFNKTYIAAVYCIKQVLKTLKDRVEILYITEGRVKHRRGRVGSGWVSKKVTLVQPCVYPPF
jgi:hypothetical protein